MSGVLKSVVQWMVYGGLALFAGGLMLLGKADTVLVERMRLQISDAVVPILDVLSQPVDTAAGALDRVGGWIAVAEENQRLRAERERLLRWQTVAQRLEGENAELRHLLNFVPEPDHSFVSARVVADSTGAFAHSVLLNAGRRDGVDKGRVVLAAQGLVGRIVGASERASRVLLITDLNSRVPVFVGPARVRAVLAGDNTDRPRLVHVVPGTDVAVGDTVVTSGIAGVFPPGLPIGVVDRVEDGRATVVPNVERSRLEYVRVADFGLATPPGERPAAAGAEAEPAAPAPRPSARADAR